MASSSSALELYSDRVYVRLIDGLATGVSLRELEDFLRRELPLQRVHLYDKVGEDGVVARGGIVYLKRADTRRLLMKHRCRLSIRRPNDVEMRAMDFHHDKVRDLQFTVRIVPSEALMPDCYEHFFDFMAKTFGDMHRFSEAILNAHFVRFWSAKSVQSLPPSFVFRAGTGRIINVRVDARQELPGPVRTARDNSTVLKDVPSAPPSAPQKPLGIPATPRADGPSTSTVPCTWRLVERVPGASPPVWRPVATRTPTSMYLRPATYWDIAKFVMRHPGTRFLGPVPDELIRALKECKRMMDEEDDEKECVVCMERERSITTEPCGHRVLCEVCAKDPRVMQHGACIMCSAPVRSVKRA